MVWMLDFNLNRSSHLVVHPANSPVQPPQSLKRYWRPSHGTCGWWLERGQREHHCHAHLSPSLKLTLLLPYTHWVLSDHPLDAIWSHSLCCFLTLLCRHFDDQPATHKQSHKTTRFAWFKDLPRSTDKDNLLSISLLVLHIRFQVTSIYNFRFLKP